MRETSTALQAVLRLRAEHFRISHNLERSKEEVAQSQARCNEFWHHRDPTQCTRDEANLSPELEWMHMEENHIGSGARGGGGMGIDVTTLAEGVAASSFAAAGDRLPWSLG